MFTTCLVRCRHDRARPEGNTDRCVKRQRSILTSSRTAAQNVHLEGMRRARNTTRALALALALWLQSATLARTSAGRHAEELETRKRVCAVWLSSKHRHQSDLVSCARAARLLTATAWLSKPKRLRANTARFRMRQGRQGSGGVHLTSLVGSDDFRLEVRRLQCKPSSAVSIV